MTTDIDIVRRARERLNDSYDSHDVATWMVRDLELTKEAGLYDLAWAMSQNYHTHAEAVHLCDQLIAFYEEQSDD